MSSLHSAIDELRDEDVRRVADDQLECDVIELQHLSDSLLVERARRIAEIEKRASYKRDGYLSTAAWLADSARVSFSAAKREVTTALALDRMPLTQLRSRRERSPVRRRRR